MWLSALSSSDEEWPYDDRDEDYNPGAGKDDMQEDETMSSEAREEESHSTSGGVGVDEEVSDSSNNNTMREEDRSRLKAPTQPFPPLLYINIPYLISMLLLSIPFILKVIWTFPFFEISSPTKFLNWFH